MKNRIIGTKKKNNMSRPIQYLMYLVVMVMTILYYPIKTQRSDPHQGHKGNPPNPYYFPHDCSLPQMLDKGSLRQLWSPHCQYQLCACDYNCLATKISIYWQITGYRISKLNLGGHSYSLMMTGSHGLHWGAQSWLYIRPIN